MCGGAGTRLNRGEKPLFEVGGKPMLDRVLDALAASHVEAVHAVTSPHVPKTARHLETRDRLDIIETAGDGYVADLSEALDRIDTPVVTAAADIPCLASECIDRTINAHDGGSLAVCVPPALKRRLGVSVDAIREREGRELAPTGLNVVGKSEESVRVSHDARLAINVNRPDDALVAEEFIESPGEP